VLACPESRALSSWCKSNQRRDQVTIKYSLLIVDDEPLAIRGVQLAVAWDWLGIDNIYTANNAAQAEEVYGITVLT
jgi:hypothetical protein